MRSIEPTVGARYTIGSHIYEIISITNDQVSLCSLVNQFRRYLDHLTFTAMQQRGEIVLQQRAPADNSMSAQYASLSEAEKERYQLRLSYLRRTLDQFGGRLPKNDTELFIKKIEHENNDAHAPAYSTLARWKNIYFSCFRNPLAFLGAVRKPRPTRIDQRAEELLKHYLSTSYLTLERPSMKHSYRLLCGHIVAENKIRFAQNLPTINTPSYSTFKRRIDKLDKNFLTTKRCGKKASKKLNKFGGHLYVSEEPYENTQFDSHCMDVIIVDEEGKLLGRPTLSVHLHPASRWCCGWDISPGAPAAEKMMRATISAIATQGKMSTITTDNGPEIFNTWAQSYFKLLGISVDYVPKEDPDAKAFIERFFKTVNSGFSHNLRGTTRGSPTDRGDYPSEDEACLTITKLRELFAAWLDVYHDTWHEGIQTSPRIKQAELAQDALPPQKPSEEELNNLCLSVWRLRITAGRVTRRKLFWTGPGLPEIGQRLGKSQKAIVYYNPCNLGTVWVAHPDKPDEWHTAYGTQPSYQEGLALSDHNQVIAMMNEQKLKFNHETADEALYHLNNNLQILQNKDKKTKKPKGTTRLPLSTRRGTLDVPIDMRDLIDNQTMFPVYRAHAQRGEQDEQ